MLSRLLRPIRCWLGNCPCRQVDTEYGISGMCVDCGKVVGFVSRKTLRAYADRDAARK